MELSFDASSSTFGILRFLSSIMTFGGRKKDGSMDTRGKVDVDHRMAAQDRWFLGNSKY